MVKPDLKTLSQLRGMRDGSRFGEEQMLNLLRFMCSDDDDNWDQAKADKLLARIKKAQATRTKKPAGKGRKG